MGSVRANSTGYVTCINVTVLDADNTRDTVAMVIGLARGFQIFLLKENGEFEEVLSERKGPLRVAHLLPMQVTGEDKVVESRPLMGLVDGNPMSAENKFCAVSFVSLRTGEQVNQLRFDEPVLELSSSKSCVLVALSESIVVCDPGTLKERCCVVVPPNIDASLPPIFSLNDRLLAFADCSLNSGLQSCGGRMDAEDDQSYSGQVMSAAKSLSKTVTSIGEQLVSSFSSPSQEKRNGVTLEKGVVSIVDTLALPESDSTKPNLSHYLAHFIAHRTGVGSLCFGNGGRLICTGNLASTTFHLFLIHPHPISSALGAVQHIYTLHRGNSVAKVIDTAFTDDNRWLALATNHGTTHLYAITPYGGPVNLRTHAGRFVNKESNFERTAGLSAETQLSYSVHSKIPSPGTTFRENPLTQNALLTRSVTNPRFSRFPPPVVLWAHAKIKQKVFSAENLSAWATDNSPVTISSSTRVPQLANGHPIMFESHRRMALCFGTAYGERCAGRNVPVLFVMSPDGSLCQYKIEVRKDRVDSTGSSNASVDEPNRNLELPVRVKVIALSEWHLTRNRGTTGIDFIVPPLPDSSPLLWLADCVDQERGRPVPKPARDNWMQHVEVSTYCGPHRRLWMGPQFSFGVYAYTGHSSAELVSPSGPSQMLAAKCCPVLIEKNSAGARPENLEKSTRIVCGAWGADQSQADDPQMANLRLQLEDAMRDELELDEASPGRRQRKLSSTPSSTSSSKLLPPMPFARVDSQPRIRSSQSPSE